MPFHIVLLAREHVPLPSLYDHIKELKTIFVTAEKTFLHAWIIQKWLNKLTSTLLKTDKRVRKNNIF